MLFVTGSNLPHSARMLPAALRPRRGQSLVEFVLVLPILLMIIAAVLEVGNVLTLYNRVQLAAREGARFAAAGGTDASVMEVVRQASEESLTYDPAQMSIWVIRPVILTDGASYWSWKDGSATDWGVPVVCVFGDDCTMPIQPSDVLNSFKSFVGGDQSQRRSLDGQRLSIVVVYYKADTILNLPFFRVPGESQGRVPLWAYTVLIQEIEQTTINLKAGGCSAYPIGIYEDVIPANAEEDQRFSNIPRGDTGFQFLSWRGAGTSQLGVAMAYPGNSTSPTTGYKNPVDPSDIQMHRGDYVWGAVWDGSWGTTQSAMDDHIAKGRAVRAVIYSQYDIAPKYLVSNFVIIRIRGYGANFTTLTFDFVRFDESCGFDH